MSELDIYEYFELFTYIPLDFSDNIFRLFKKEDNQCF